ncbi:MAG TPA: Ig-like domain-containing protein, partial [Solirubrobacteraceae bacterium]
PFLPVPTCSNVTARGKKGATRVTLTLKCKGPKGHSFSYGIVSKPSSGKLGKVNQSNGKVTYTTHVGFSGTDRFVYNATDSGGSSKAATATIVLPRLQRIAATMGWAFQPTLATYTVIDSFTISGVPGGAKVLLSCKAKGGCPISKHTATVPKHRVCKGKGTKRKCRSVEPALGNVDLTSLVAHRHVAVGARVFVAMIEPGWIGKEYIFTFVKNRQPSKRIVVLAPGSTRLCPTC